MDQNKQEKANENQMTGTSRETNRFLTKTLVLPPLDWHTVMGSTAGLAVIFAESRGAEGLHTAISDIMDRFTDYSERRDEECVGIDLKIEKGVGEPSDKELLVIVKGIGHMIKSTRSTEKTKKEVKDEMVFSDGQVVTRVTKE
jgi:hypothetical protein